MKKLIGILLLANLIIIAGCNSKGQETTDSDKNILQPAPKVENKVIEAKPVQLTKEMFIEKIMDYETNKTEWVFKGDKPCIIDFYADWCAPCRKVAPIMNEFAKEYEGKVDIYKINTDQEKELAGVFGIQSIPSILFCPKEGQPRMYAGAFPKEDYVKIMNELFFSQSQTNNN